MADHNSVEVRNNALNSFTATIGNGGFLEIFDDSAGVPISAAAPALGVLLIKFTLASPYAPPAINGVLTPTSPVDTPYLAGGTALYYREYKNDMTCCRQGDVVLVGNGLVLNPPNNVVVAGLPGHIQSWTKVIGGA